MRGVPVIGIASAMSHVYVWNDAVARRFGSMILLFWSAIAAKR